MIFSDVSRLVQADWPSPWGNGATFGHSLSAFGTTIAFEPTMPSIGVALSIGIMGSHGSRPGGVCTAEVQRPTAPARVVCMVRSRVVGLKATNPL